MEVKIDEYRIMGTDRNLREGPGVHRAVIGEVKKGQTVHFTLENYQLRNAGDEGPRGVVGDLWRYSPELGGWVSVEEYFTTKATK